jgi:aryl-alcohol dehydrogenase-like predicted oxidoreductase
MDTIEYRPLGTTGIKVASMGVGTQAWGATSFGYGTTFTEKDVLAAFKASLDAGVNLFDTSDSYAKGASEKLLGKFIKDDGRPVIIASKFTQSKWYDPGNYKSHKDVLPALDKTLQNIGIRTLDLYQLHYPEAPNKINGYLDALAETVKSGKAKAIGVCNFNAERLQHACEYLDKQNIPIASNQIAYNLIFRHPETNGILKTCNELKVSPIAIFPLAEGILTGKYRVGSAEYPRNVKMIMKVLQLDLFSTGYKQFWLKSLFKKPYQLEKEKLEPLFALMFEIAKSHNATIVQVALNWLLMSHPKMIYIPGAKNLRQAGDNLASLKWNLKFDEFQKLNKLENELWLAYKK